jgi:ribosomal protein S12 methylthiotransferase accessory factor
MTDTLPKGYTSGMHRVLAPEATLAKIAPQLASFGITRCADVTGLDRLGIPVYCAIRPRNRTLQVSNGKGLRPADAKVSALMEAIELFHAEYPNGALERTSLKSMLGDGRRVLSPSILPDYRTQLFFSADFVIDWVKAEDLLSNQDVWLPASAAYLCSPMLYHWSSNGLASGNHLVEATLHGLYELIERDAVSRLSSKGRVSFSPKHCRFIDQKTVSDRPVRELHDQLLAADIKLVLIWVKSCVPVHTFLAVLLDREAFSLCSQVNIGYGCHLSVSVAATRAITEAAQSRLTFIHGSREDLTPDAYLRSHREVYDFFDRIEGTTPWRTFRDRADDDLLQDYAYILHRLSARGYKNIFRVNMTRSPFEIPVAKVLVSGLSVNHNLV